MSQLETNVSFHVLVPRDGFLSLNPLKVLSFRSAERAGADQDPCAANSERMRCTYLNFHIEVPEAQFVVFKKPIRLQFSFGRKGWQDLYYRPKLYYWESYKEEWSDVHHTCPPSRYTT